jgi:membrane-anchored protein YejM (alkaline phosphatase superfamily)
MAADVPGDNSQPGLVGAVPFDAATLEVLRERQIQAVRHIDGVMEQLYDRVPDNTWLIVTSDHGELFGEDGYFGHGPILHEKVLEVPFVEGVVPR